MRFLFSILAFALMQFAGTALAQSYTLAPGATSAPLVISGATTFANYTSGTWVCTGGVLPSPASMGGAYTPIGATDSATFTAPAAPGTYTCTLGVTDRTEPCNLKCIATTPITVTIIVEEAPACFGKEGPFADEAAWLAAGGHPHPDCDGDGSPACGEKDEPGTCDPYDGDPCKTKDKPEGPCGDPKPELSGADQARAAFAAFGTIARHIEYRLETSGQEHDSYLMQYSFENEDRSMANGGRWAAMGLSSTELSGQLSGDGMHAHALVGWDINEGEDSLWGYVLGGEYGDWSYDGDGAVQKLGLGAGIYGGRLLSDRLQVTGYLTYTHFLNELSTVTGQSASMQSDRLIAMVGINGKIGTSGGFTVKPFLDAQYAIERSSGYSYSGGGGTFAGGTAEVGEISLGAEINLPFRASWGSAFLRIEAEKSFGAGSITLSDGTVMAPHEDVTGSVGLGWVTNTSYDSIGRIELSVNDIGNDAREEIRLDGHWERNF